MDRKIKVLHIVGAMYPGGMENFIMNIYENIDKERFQFDFLWQGRGVGMLLIPQLNLEFSACLNTELLRRKGLKYASIPAPSLLEFQHLFFA